MEFFIIIKTDSEKIEILLKKDTLSNLISSLINICDDCEAEKCPRSGCGYLEQEGLQIGPVHVYKELFRRKLIIDKALNEYNSS